MVSLTEKTQTCFFLNGLKNLTYIKEKIFIKIYIKFSKIHEKSKK